MPYKPKNNKSGGNWLGFKELAIMDIEDIREKYQGLSHLEVALDINLEIKGAEYGQKLQIIGDFERDDESNILPCSLLTQINNFCAVIDFPGGVNRGGEWVDKDDKPIENIVELLNDRYIDVKFPDPDFKYYGYLYEKYNDKKERVYTHVWKKIVKNTKEEIASFKDYMKFIKSKGYVDKNRPSEQPKIKGEISSDI